MSSWLLAVLPLLAGAYLFVAYLREHPRREQSAYLFGAVSCLALAFLIAGLSSSQPWAAVLVAVAVVLQLVATESVRRRVLSTARRLRGTAPAAR